MDVATARKRLESLLTDLNRSIGALRGEPGSEKSAADAGTDLTDADVHAMLDVATQHCAAVLGALKRLDAGEYGRCVTCGGPVPDERLEARPEAARCVPCQSRADRRR